jgi:hypothetical protein
VAMQKIEDIKNYGIINAAILLLNNYPNIIFKNLEVLKKQIFDLLISYLEHNNKKVKENSSDALFSIF